ncbi:SIR2 family protein [Ruegeria atlantica]|uniref:SIR2 family protein n=1 Tax=Ruegeria atlantica TaxID=81569 RepID=UPI002494032E|nr:SIR2 family protein [Ruegeria atlantica]
MDQILPDQETPSLNFIKGAVDTLKDVQDKSSWASCSAIVQEQVSDALGARNLSFLFGAGCSSLMEKDEVLEDLLPAEEKGIPTMAPLAAGFKGLFGGEAKASVTNEEIEALTNVLGIDLKDEAFSKNLERLLEVLLATKVFADTSNSSAIKAAKTHLESVIGKVITYVTEACSKPKLAENSNPVFALYQKFYQRLVLRDRTLPRPWVFTTNYDLFSERAMDRLSIPYCNGFSGSVEQRLNPATFRYALAEQLDITSKRWAAVDSFVYLCKLHGSINWVEDGEGLFPIRALQDVPATDADHRVMIYPTPAKQNTSFGAPYSDLFREFQKQVVQDQSVLIIAGYGFGDEHVNNLVFQALTIPGFRLVIFGDPDLNEVTKTLGNLEDPRIWFIWGEGPEGGMKAHYFKTIVEHFLPAGPGNRTDHAVEKALKAFGVLAGKKDGGEADAG